jgi:hypothetical protein
VYTCSGCSSECKPTTLTKTVVIIFVWSKIDRKYPSQQLSASKRIKSTWMDENATTDIDIDHLYGQENPTWVLHGPDRVSVDHITASLRALFNFVPTLQGSRKEGSPILESNTRVESGSENFAMLFGLLLKFTRRRCRPSFVSTRQTVNTAPGYSDKRFFRIRAAVGGWVSALSSQSVKPLEF